MATNTTTPTVDPEDMFAETRMSFGDHIEDLRSHLIRAMVGFVIGMVICIVPPVGPWAVRFIVQPVETQLQEFFDRIENQPIEPAMLSKIPPLRTMMRIHIPTLKAAVQGEGGGDVFVHAPHALDAVIDRMMDKKLADDGRNWSEWANVPIEIPNPIELAKAVNDSNRIIRPKRLATMNVQEAFIVYFKVALLLGLVLSSPWVFFQIWTFVAAGLYPHEKKLVNHYLPVSVFLFLAGFAVCQFFALPKAIEALLWFNEWLGFTPDLRLNEWLSFAILMPLVFGISFQTPLVMLFMYKIGIAEIDTFRSKRNICYFAMAVMAAILTPSTDVPTMMMLWVPMCLLFEVGIWLCMLQPTRLVDSFDDSELDEMIGV